MNIIRIVVALFALLTAMSSALAEATVEVEYAHRWDNSTFIFEGEEIVLEPREKATIHKECQVIQRDMFTTTTSCTSKLTVFNTAGKVRYEKNGATDTRKVGNFILIFSATGLLLMLSACILGYYGLSYTSERITSYLLGFCFFAALLIGLSGSCVIDPSCVVLELAGVGAFVAIVAKVFQEKECTLCLWICGFCYILDMMAIFFFKFYVFV